MECKEVSIATELCWPNGFFFESESLWYILIVIFLLNGNKPLRCETINQSKIEKYQEKQGLGIRRYTQAPQLG